MASTPGLLPGLLHWKARCRLLQSFPPIRSRRRRPGRCGGSACRRCTGGSACGWGGAWRGWGWRGGEGMGGGGGVALVVVAAVAALVLGHQPDYRVLFGNLSEKDGGTIVAQLSQMNVPYRLAEGG